MKAVWLSSTYYFDEEVEKLSPNAERMLTRGIAFCGNAETSGYITTGQINMLGLPNPKRLLKELVDGDILVPQPDGRYYFDAWQDWNSSGDKLIARQKADRERQARLRESKRNSRDASREKSRDVTHPEKRRTEQNSGHVPESATDSNGRGAAAATIGAQLVDQAGIDPSLPVVGELRKIATDLVKSGQSAPADVVEGLVEWNSRTGIGPGVLRSLISDVVKRRNGHTRAAPNGNGQPSSKIRTLVELEREVRATESAQIIPLQHKEIQS